MGTKLEAMLAQADQVARSDIKQAVNLFGQGVNEAFAGEYPNSERGIALLLLALTERKAGSQEQAQATIARLLVFCGRTGEMGVFAALREHAALEDCRQILTLYCPADASVDETLGLLTGLDKMLPAATE